MQEPVILPSAYRHGVKEEDIRHAYRNPFRSERDQGDHSLVMLTGPARNGVTLLEIGVLASTDGTPLIIHAMPARDSYL